MLKYVKISSGRNDNHSNLSATCKMIAKNSFFLSIITAFAIAIFPCKSVASYLIELKSGTQFITDHYWEEGDQIRFNLYGGTAGVHRKLIKLIKETDQPYEYEEPERKGNQPGALPPGKISEIDVVEEKGKAEIPAISEDQKDAFLMKKEAIMSDVDKAREDFQKAKERNDKKQMRIQRERLLKSYDDMQVLFDEVKTANGGEPPDWWQTLWP